MGRARGKAKKHTTNSGIEEESGSGEEEKAYQKRGRPQKQVKDETKIQEIEKADEEHRKNADGILLTSKDVKKQAAKESAKKRKRSSKAEGKSISTKEDGVVTKSKEEEEDVSARKSVGLRQHGSRRKSTPRRAAEVGVECY